MADKQETITDIIKKIRAEADYIEETARGSLKAGENYDGIAFTESDLESALDLAETKRKEADRLDAARKREKAAIEADALSVGGLVEAMRQKKAICTKCRDGEPPKNCQFFGEPDGCSSPTYGHYPQLPIGNAAKLREALSKSCAYSAVVLNTGMFNRVHLEALLNMAKAALAAPPRNCDVGTAEEQEKRFHDFCRARHLPRMEDSSYCAYKCPLEGGTCCELAWAQMPCEEGGTDGNE